MNPDTNKFEPLFSQEEVWKQEAGLERKIAEKYSELCRANGEPVPKHWIIFTVGESYVINNYTFRCVYIGETSILFEPVGPIVVNPDGG